MALDGIVLRALAAELHASLAGGRIDRIQQPTESDIIMSIRANRTNHRLLISAQKSYPRAHLTTRFVAPNPLSPPMFCMLMRKHLEGSHILRVEQHSCERILFMDVAVRDELGELAERRLVLEIMGKHSNLILLDRPEGMIIDSISHISFAINRHREVLPGRAYVYPPAQNKADPWQETEEGFLQKRKAAFDLHVNDFVVQSYLGVSPFFGRELRCRLQDQPDPTPDLEWRIFQELLQQAAKAEQPTIIDDATGHGQAFYVFPPAQVHGVARDFPSISECLDAFYSDRALTDIARAKAGSFLRIVRMEKEKALQKAQKFRALLSATEDAESWRIMGELLTAYLHQVPKGARLVHLANFYDEGRELRIELDPAKTAMENANAYFKRYAKYKKGLAVTAAQLQLSVEDAAYLDSVQHELEHCRIEDLPAIEAELREAGILKKRPTAKSGGKKAAGDSRAKTAEKIAPAIYYAKDGTPIWVGRNNRENDAMTFKLAKKSDTWLHVKDAPGSHVVIPHSSPSDEALRAAGLLAAYFSRLRDSTKAPVDVLPIKNLRKPNKARPGFVIFEGQRTLMVQVDQEAVEAVLQSKEG